MTVRDQRTLRMNHRKPEQSEPFRYPNIRFTESEWDLLQLRLEQSGMSAQSFGRDCLLGQPVVVMSGFLEMAEQIRRIGVNVNQVAKVANYDTRINEEHLDEIHKELKMIWRLLSSFLSEVRAKSSTR